jgi:phosphoenolpyruvate carboxykinase (GTP)
MADHWQHWLDVGHAAWHRTQPCRAFFQVNWFRTGDDGSFLWPGFGENARVLEWIQARVDGQVGAKRPRSGTFRTTRHQPRGSRGWSTLDQLFAIDRDAWLAEADDTEQFFETFGAKVPHELYDQLATLRTKLEASE